MALSALHRAARPSLSPVCVLLALACFGPMNPVVAQSDYPNKTITVITPYAPAGAGDLTMRTLAKFMSKELGRQVIVDNRPGGATALGLGIVAKAAPDGYTIAYAPQTMVVNPHLYKNLPYDTFADFLPIAKTALLKYVLVVNPSVPVNNMKELLALAAAKPEMLTFGSSGFGNGSHLGGELLMKMTGVKFLHIAYKGAAPAMLDVIGGRISMMFDVVSTAEPHIRAGKVRAIAVASLERSAVLPNVPTVAETVPGYFMEFWIGLAAPKGTPPDRVALLNRVVNTIIVNPELKQGLRAIGIDSAEPNTPAEFAAFMRAEYKLWGDLIRDNNIKAE